MNGARLRNGTSDERKCMLAMKKIKMLARGRIAPKKEGRRDLYTSSVHHNNLGTAKTRRTEETEEAWTADEEQWGMVMFKAALLNGAHFAGETGRIVLTQGFGHAHSEASSREENVPVLGFATHSIVKAGGEDFVVLYRL